MKQLLIVAMLTGSTTLFAQQQTNPATQEYIDRLEKVLSLKPEQKQRIKDGSEHLIVRRAVIATDQSYSEQDRKSIIHGLDTLLANQLKSALTPDQWKKWESQRVK